MLVLPCGSQRKERVSFGCWSRGAVSKSSKSELHTVPTCASAAHRQDKCTSAAFVSRRQMTRPALQQPIDATSIPEDWTCLCLCLHLAQHLGRKQRRHEGRRPQPAPPRRLQGAVNSPLELKGKPTSSNHPLGLRMHVPIAVQEQRDIGLLALPFHRDWNSFLIAWPKIAPAPKEIMGPRVEYPLEIGCQSGAHPRPSTALRRIALHKPHLLHMTLQENLGLVFSFFLVLVPAWSS